MMVDAFYTPSELARDLIAQVNINPLNVADFCAGDGELLRAAESRWPNARYIATDLASEAIAEIHENHPKWETACCDFLDITEKQTCNILKNNRTKLDLILLNPPFSCRGSTRTNLVINDQIFVASTAMSFMVYALEYLSATGQIFAILPSSVAHSEKDECLWNYLAENYGLRVIKKPHMVRFNDRTPNIILASLNDFTRVKQDNKILRIEHDISIIEVFRGKISMCDVHKILHGDTALVHTVNLQKNKITRLQYNIAAKSSEVTGPAVLFPRVGNPRKDKVIVIKQKEVYVLSDCIIAIKTQSNIDASKLRKSILANWDIFRALYNGTGAKYITIKKVKQFLGI